MSLITEDGTGTADAESLCSVADADAYFTARPGTTLATAWGAASTPAKESALRQATAYFEGAYGARLPGRRISPSQALLLPRDGAYDLEGLALSRSEVWLPVRQAVAELAARALGGPLSVDTSLFSGIASASVGDLSVDLRPGSAQPGYDAVDLLLVRILGPANRVTYA